MHQLIESIKLKDGILQHLEYHQARLDYSMKELYPMAPAISLSEHLQIPENCQHGIFKVRVVYSNQIERIEFESYQARSIKSLRVVHAPVIDYHLKFLDREILHELYGLRRDCDDIIIVRNGLATDSFFANLLFFDGKKWFTPSTPLLKGTMRQILLDQGKITEKEIREEDICSFQKVGLINAMLDFETMPVIPVSQVLF